MIKVHMNSQKASWIGCACVCTGLLGSLHIYCDFQFRIVIEFLSVLRNGSLILISYLGFFFYLFVLSKSKCQFLSYHILCYICYIIISYHILCFISYVIISQKSIYFLMRDRRVDPDGKGGEKRRNREEQRKGKL